MIVCSFSDFQIPLDEYPKKLKGKRLHDWIIRQLRGRERISCFEIDSDLRMCRTLMFLDRIGKITISSKAHAYPYVGIKVRAKKGKSSE
ncbi:hypothetical protein VCHA53O466_50008 [Vibrio chagasii]|nr:hypothetical protein VCHA53O466_50008 [Vibrio chagasii]